MKILILTLSLFCAPVCAINFVINTNDDFTLLCEKPTSYVNNTVINNTITILLYTFDFNVNKWVFLEESNTCSFSMLQYIKFPYEFFYTSAKVNNLESRPSEVAIINTIAQPNPAILLPGKCEIKP